MANVVPYNPGYARGIGLANFAIQAYRNRHLANYIADGLRGGYNMVKRAYSGGYQGPPTVRRRVASRRPVRRFKKQYRYRRPYYRRRLSKYKFYKSRRRGRRTLANRYVTIRYARRYNALFTTSTVGTFNNRIFNVNNAGNWFPPAAEVDTMKKCMFDACDSKKLHSIHVYLTDVQFVKYYSAQH